MSAPGDAPGDPPHAASGRLGPWGAWGVTGIGLLFSFAIYRLGHRGVETLRAGLAPGEWAALAALIALFVWAEGVRALQRRWVPFVLGRARTLSPGVPILRRLFAPFYAMGLLAAPPRTLFRAWMGVVAVILAVLLVHELPEPWRGIVDLAVTAALAWGLVTLGMRAVGPADGSAAPAGEQEGVDS